MSSRKTVKEVSDALGASRFTLSQAAHQGRLGASARQEGRNWIIDVDHADYKVWEAAHAHQPRVKGGHKKDSVEAK